MTPPPESPPEVSAFWPIVVILGEIAERVERGQAAEASDDQGDRASLQALDAAASLRKDE